MTYHYNPDNSHQDYSVTSFFYPKYRVFQKLKLNSKSWIRNKNYLIYDYSLHYENSIGTLNL